MRIRTLIARSLRHYRRSNLLLIFGVAISTAVLTGALIIGDSIKHSLNRIVDERLGETTHFLTAGDRYFTEGFSQRIQEELNDPVTALLQVEGSVVVDGGGMRLSKVQMYGVEPAFDTFAGTDSLFESLQKEEVMVSAHMASRLGIAEGDELLLKMKRASLIPLNAPFVSDADQFLNVRVRVRSIVGTHQLGDFNLKTSQTPPLNVFLSLEWLEKIMEVPGKRNLMLLATSASGDELKNSMSKAFSLEDAGLKLNFLEEQQLLELTSERVFLDDVIANDILDRFEYTEPVVTYFVNSLGNNGRSTPYSFVSTLPDYRLPSGRIILTDWLAEDIGADIRDTITLSYFAMGPLRKLEVRDTAMVVDNIVPITGEWDDPDRMPDIPGLSDVGNCRDWETGVPIVLDAIRDKDERYWTRYKGTPKAYISAKDAVDLWSNRFGTYTAIRFSDAQESPMIFRMLSRLIDPQELGFMITPVRERSVAAAGDGVDFAQLFGGLSFFLLLGGILLSAMLFLLNMEARKDQVFALRAMGYSLKRVRYIFLGESILIGSIGALLGLFLAVGYTLLVFLALEGVWSDIVRTRILIISVELPTMVIGFLASLLISILAILLPLRRILLEAFHKQRRTLRVSIARKWMKRGGLLSFGAALAFINLPFLGSGETDQAAFFLSGGLLLLAGVLWSMYTIHRPSDNMVPLNSLNALSRLNRASNISRSSSIVALFALATFLVLSTGMNRKDLFEGASEPSSGAGGFLYYGESTLPFLSNLNDSTIRYDLGLTADFDIRQFRVAEGDDASCLNLNRISTPRILGVQPDDLSGRFTFVSRSKHLLQEDPWATLEMDLPGNLVPAIADETVIKWGLKLQVGDTLFYRDARGDTLQLLLVGGLAPSIFQGNVIIAERYFLEHFPSSSGSNVFLVEGSQSDTALISEELFYGLRDYGWDLQYAPRRLAEFNSVTNTYLSVFMALGMLGLILGTIGLAAIMLKSLMERRGEFAMYISVGYSRKEIRKMVLREYLGLLLSGIGIGTIAAFVATLPAIWSPNTALPVGSIFVLLGILLLNGWLWIYGVSGKILKMKAVNQALRND